MPMSGTPRATNMMPQQYHHPAYTGPLPYPTYNPARLPYAPPNKQPPGMEKPGGLPEVCRGFRPMVTALIKSVYYEGINPPCEICCLFTHPLSPPQGYMHPHYPGMPVDPQGYPYGGHPPMHPNDKMRYVHPGPPPQPSNGPSMAPPNNRTVKSPAGQMAPPNAMGRQPPQMGNIRPPSSPGQRNAQMSPAGPPPNMSPQQMMGMRPNTAPPSAVNNGYVFLSISLLFISL